MSFPNIHFLRDNDPYKISATRGALALGTVGVTEDGRWYRYSKAGSSALAAGKLMQAEVPGANFDELAVVSGTIGSKDVVVTNGATAITANMFRDGYLNVEDDTGEGILYRIASNTADAGTGPVTVTLTNGLAVALTTSTTVGLSKHKCDATIIHPSPPTAGLVGVPNVAVTASYYYWAQFRGPCSVLTDGSILIGKLVMASDAIDGAMEVYTTAGDDEIPTGQTLEVAADTEYSLIDLFIP